MSNVDYTKKIPPTNPASHLGVLSRYSSSYECFREGPASSDSCAELRRLLWRLDARAIIPGTYLGSWPERCMSLSASVGHDGSRCGMICGELVTPENCPPPYCPARCGLVLTSPGMNPGRRPLPSPCSTICPLYAFDAAYPVPLTTLVLRDDVGEGGAGMLG